MALTACAGGAAPATPDVQPVRTGRPPLPVYILALDQALVRLKPTATHPIAVYPPPGVVLPAAVLEDRGIQLSRDPMPCAGADVIALLPARRDTLGQWIVETSERRIGHGLSGGGYNAIRCVGSICAVHYSVPVARDEIVGCPVR